MTIVSLRIDFCNDSVWELLVGGDYIESWEGSDLHISWMGTELGA